MPRSTKRHARRSRESWLARSRFTPDDLRRLRNASLLTVSLMVLSEPDAPSFLSESIRKLLAWIAQIL